MTTVSIPLFVGDARPTRVEAVALAFAASVQRVVARRLADRAEHASRAAERRRRVEDVRASVALHLSQHPLR